MYFFCDINFLSRCVQRWASSGFWWPPSAHPLNRLMNGNSPSGRVTLTPYNPPILTLHIDTETLVQCWETLASLTSMITFVHISYYVLNGVMKAANGKISSCTPHAWHLALFDGSCQDLLFTIVKVWHESLWQKQAVWELIQSLESENMGVIMRL